VKLLLDFYHFPYAGGVDFLFYGLFCGFDGIFKVIFGSTAPETPSFLCSRYTARA
jgi:hypothetical protein